jgi:hypothetical protein
MFQTRLTTADRRGQSLLEVIVAVGMMVIALAPALVLMRDGVETSRDLETRQLLTTLGVGRLDRELAVASADWQTATVNGDYSSQGYPDLKYSVTHSDSPADGGIVDRLMSVRVTIWEDVDNNGSPSGGELQAVFRSKIARLASYEAQALP